MACVERSADVESVEGQRRIMPQDWRKQIPRCRWVPVATGERPVDVEGQRRVMPQVQWDAVAVERSLHHNWTEREQSPKREG